MRLHEWKNKYGRALSMAGWSIGQSDSQTVVINTVTRHGEKITLRVYFDEDLEYIANDYADDPAELRHFKYYYSVSDAFRKLAETIAEEVDD